MEIAAVVTSSASGDEVSVRTGTSAQSIAVPAQSAGGGSSVTGEEFLMLALPTCFCNDLYREAQRFGIPIEGARVEALAEFPGIGLAATNIRYHAMVESPASASEIARLLRETDAVAEVHNTIRTGTPSRLLAA